MRLAGPVLVSTFLLLSTAAKAAELTVQVVGLASAKGDVHVALYDDADRFPDSDGMISKVEVQIDAPAVFKDLKPGRYAVAVYHDENANDEFDQGFLGIPLEDFGFSNDAPVFLGPPSFTDAAFDVPAEGARITVDLGN